VIDEAGAAETLAILAEIDEAFAPPVEGS